MKYLTVLLLFLTFSGFGQTVKSNFNGYGNTASVTGSGPTYTLSIVGFVGSYHSLIDGPWLATDVAIGDVIWYDCTRFVITDINSSGGSSFNVDVEVPAEDWAIGVSNPLNSQRVAVVREIEGTLPAFPPVADGNGGAFAGIPGTLFSCMLTHYVQQVNETTAAEEIACISGSGAPNNTVHTTQGYWLAVNEGCASNGILYFWDGDSWEIVGSGGGSDGTVTGGSYDPLTNTVTLTRSIGGSVIYTHKDIKYNNGVLSGSTGGYSVGLDYSTGQFYYNLGGNWERLRITDVSFVSITADATIAAGTQQVTIGTLTGNIVVTLPICNTANLGRNIKFFKSGSDSFRAEITGGQSFTDGATSKFLYSLSNTFECTCNGTNWYYGN